MLSLRENAIAKLDAALLAAEILGNKYPEIREAVRDYRAGRTQQVLDEGDPRESD